MTGEATQHSPTDPPSLMRKCSRTACAHQAVATLTYVYSDSTAVVGPLATYAEPHTYDLCSGHAERLTPPRGWDIVRITREGQAPAPSAAMALCLSDDLSAIVDAVREDTSAQQRPPGRARGRQVPSAPMGWEAGASRGHLRAVRLPTDEPGA